MEALACFLAAEAAGDEVAEPGHGVPGHVILVVDREDAELRAGLGVQQEQDPVQVAQRLAAEVLRERAVVDVAWLDALVAEPVEDLVGDDLHGLAQALAQLGGDADGVLAGTGHEGGQRFLAAFGGRLQSVGGEQGGDQLQFPGVGTLQRGVQGDGEVPAFAPGETVGEDDHAAVQQQDVPGRLVGREQPASQLRAGLDPLTVADLDGDEEPARPVGVEGGVGVGRPLAVDRDDVLPGVGDRDLERLARAFDGQVPGLSREA